VLPHLFHTKVELPLRLGDDSCDDRHGPVATPRDPDEAGPRGGGIRNVLDIPGPFQRPCPGWLAATRSADRRQPANLDSWSGS
jgi:hypothetical protein